MYAMENEAMVFAKTPAHQIAEKNQSLGKGGPSGWLVFQTCFFIKRHLKCFTKFSCWMRKASGCSYYFKVYTKMYIKFCINYSFESSFFFKKFLPPQAVLKRMKGDERRIEELFK